MYKGNSKLERKESGMEFNKERRQGRGRPAVLYREVVGAVYGVDFFVVFRSIQDSYDSPGPHPKLN